MAATSEQRRAAVVALPLIEHAELLRLVRYEPETGHFFWLVDRGRRPFAGKLAGTAMQRRDAAGRARGGCYWQLIIKRRNYAAHRLAWFYVHGEWPRREIDHINGDPSDNRIANLRDVSRGINAQNRYSARRDSTTGLQGIERRGDRWLVSIGINGKKRYLGTFRSPDEAVRFRNDAKAELHPGAIHHRLGAVTSIPQGGFNRDSSAGCRSSEASVRRRPRVVTGGQHLPPQQVAAPDDRPLGKTAGAAPEKSEGSTS